MSTPKKPAAASNLLNAINGLTAAVERLNSRIDDVDRLAAETRAYLPQMEIRLSTAIAELAHATSGASHYRRARDAEFEARIAALEAKLAG